MSIKEFSSVIQSEIYKSWLKSLDDNILTSTVGDMRAKEQVAAKTDFLISTADIRSMYKNVTNKELSNARAKTILKKIAQQSSKDIPIKALRVSTSGALMFETIGFDTITRYVTNVFDELDGVQEAYEKARDNFLVKKEQEIMSDPKLKTGAQKQKALDAAKKQASKIGFGAFVHKGHVVSIATNTAKSFRDSLVAASAFTEAQKELMLGILDKYIEKLQKDDLATANLPNAHKQEVYARYIKDSSKYLVELQFSSTNIEAGSASLPIVTELRKLFENATENVVTDLSKSNTLGTKLLTTKSSPSMLELMTADIVGLISKGKKPNKTYTGPNTLVQQKTRKISKGSNKPEIAKLKALKSKVKAKKPLVVPTEQSIAPLFAETNLTQLLSLLNADLVDRVKANMGDGNARNVLNLRTGRLAESAKVERLSQSRAGMITAFYSYMKNPYATFSDGGRQQYPRTRDPKLLISKSIREIASAQVTNRLRAVLV